MPRTRRAAIAISALTGALSAVLLVAGPTPASATTGNPVGILESATVSTTHVTVTGWAADPSSTASIRVVVTRDGGIVTTVMANLRRDDVALEFPKFGRSHGYTATVTVPAGTHTVCVRAANVGPGLRTQLGCAPVTVAGTPVRPVLPVATRVPFGYLDQATYASGKLTLSGWSVDPDTTAATIVDVSVGGVRLASSIANLDRPDVALAFPRYGRRHGFVVTVPMTAPSLHFSACLIALNTGAGPSKRVGCRRVSAAPSHEPAVLGTAAAAQAAIAVQAEAIASGAARLTEFPTYASPAARIAVGARALLEQATGHRKAPKPKAGVPAFQVVTPAKPVDEQAVMGPTQDLGSYPAAHGGRTGSSGATAVFHGDPLPTPSSAGVGMAGAAPVLPANGITVRPSLPSYRPGVVRVRAEIALGSALKQLGLPYVFAAAGPKTFDCSGLTMWAWAKAGVHLDHFTGTQVHQGVRVQRNQLLPGDLMLFGSDVHHVGMYVGAGYMVNAPYTGAYVRIAKVSWSGDFSIAVRP
ncbi:MAG TPA: NlpC/P60 family protein [Jatrophihabitantaceae bacterium]|nr:NlpC/P60 family protein [Jatrophihabitantaceae bacterium]